MFTSSIIEENVNYTRRKFVTTGSSCYHGDDGDDGDKVTSSKIDSSKTQSALFS